MGNGWASLALWLAPIASSSYFIHHTCPQTPPPCARLRSGRGAGLLGPLSRWTAVGMWRIQTRKQIPMIQGDRISVSLLQTESYLAPTGPCTCPLPGASVSSGVCTGCLRVVSAAVALLTIPSGCTAVVNKKPSMQPFFLLQPIRTAVVSFMSRKVFWRDCFPWACWVGLG